MSRRGPAFPNVLIHDIEISVMSMPPAPDSMASKTPSARCWRNSRARLAPRAARNDISYCRTTERASTRFATLTQAISKTRITATASTVIAGLIGSISTSFAGTTSSRGRFDGFVERTAS